MLSDLITNINKESYESKENLFTTINVRPNAKMMAMIDLMTTLEGKNPTTGLSEEFSDFIYHFLISSEAYVPIIEKIIEADLPCTGANRLLLENDVIVPDLKLKL